MLDLLRSLFGFKQKEPFICGWAMNAGKEEGDRRFPMPDEIIELIDIYGSTLEHREMEKLAEMFAYWAVTEDITDDRRARLIERATQFARLADFLGPGWIPCNCNDPPDVLKFLALDALEADNARRDWKGDQSRQAALFLDHLASRMKILLEASPDPDHLTERICERAERAGIVTSDMRIRKLPYTGFVRDLLLDNPQAIEWARRAFELTDAEGLEGEQALLAVLR